MKKMIVRIYNLNKGAYGVPFRICQRHYDELESKFGEPNRKWSLILEVMAVSKDIVCDRCADEQRDEE